MIEISNGNYPNSKKSFSYCHHKEKSSNFEQFFVQSSLQGRLDVVFDQLFKNIKSQKMKFYVYNLFSNLVSVKLHFLVGASESCLFLKRSLIKESLKYYRFFSACRSNMSIYKISFGMKRVEKSGPFYKIFISYGCCKEQQQFLFTN